jgi:A/G-specific adenine glycosylase
LAAAPVPAAWREAGEVEHGFTHFTLSLRVLRAEGDWGAAIWRPRTGIEAMPSVFLKAARRAFASL